MKMFRPVLITIGLGLAAAVIAGAQTSPVNPHAGHTVVATGGLVDVVRDVVAREARPKPMRLASV